MNSSLVPWEGRHENSSVSDAQILSTNCFLRGGTYDAFHAHLRHPTLLSRSVHSLHGEEAEGRIQRAGTLRAMDRGSERRLTSCCICCPQKGGKVAAGRQTVMSLPLRSNSAWGAEGESWRRTPIRLWTFPLSTSYPTIDVIPMLSVGRFTPSPTANPNL